MNLLNKKNLYIIILYLAIFSIIGVISFFIFQYFIYEDFKEKLQYRRDHVINFLKTSDSVLVFQKYSRNALDIKIISRISDSTEAFSDTVIYDPLEKQDIVYIQMKFQKEINGKAYEIKLRNTEHESTDFAEAIAAIMVLILLFLLLLLFFGQRWVLRKIWKPFYEIIDQMRNYEIGKSAAVDFPATDIKEFKELEIILKGMIARIYQDYSKLKEFTENVSHEIQTPLAVIKSKLELISQSDLSEEQSVLVNNCFQSITRLSKLNEALVLLSRIDNDQFSQEGYVEFTDILLAKLEYYKELIDLKKIKVDVHIDSRIEKKMNFMLADILIDNLLTNAIKHNLEGGNIRIQAEPNRLMISNSGNPLEEKPEIFFKRFSKFNSGSMGLGLSIVEKICQINGIGIKYTYGTGIHSMLLFV
ncbi:MAG: sensor histidine kinase [Cytophagaceae bacterium]